MSAVAMLLLRVSMGLLMLVWGLDKLVNPEHGVRVAERFYAGFLSSATLMPMYGAAQCALGALVIAGWGRRLSYPALIAITAATLVGVWRSIIDPWGWYLQGTNALFFPSLIVFAAALVLHSARSSDRYALDRILQR
jgi:putative oxidoreductase